MACQKTPTTQSLELLSVILPDFAHMFKNHDPRLSGLAVNANSVHPCEREAEGNLTHNEKVM
jgi:hypothetical protein